MNLPFVFAVWAVQKTMTQGKKDELKEIIQQSLTRAGGDYALVGQLPAKRINLTSEESVDYLVGFNFRMGIRERAAIEEFQELLLEIEKLERV
jgi:predicted solute-binding protein